MRFLRTLCAAGRDLLSARVALHPACGQPLPGPAHSRERDGGRVGVSTDDCGDDDEGSVLCAQGLSRAGSGGRGCREAGGGVNMKERAKPRFRSLSLSSMTWMFKKHTGPTFQMQLPEPQVGTAFICCC